MMLIASLDAATDQAVCTIACFKTTDPTEREAALQRAIRFMKDKLFAGVYVARLGNYERRWYA